NYLERAGEKLAGMRAALRDDAELGEMLDTPLMLSIAALAYAGTPAPVHATGAVALRRQQLFDAYIGKMFKRHSKEMRYAEQETT
ncbi:hypothetical protein, partial [Salmonella sp. SAL4443]|uniref:hypothetical protein n=1 Tax=Salmonella sp. SAL4443 TaxID=3159898 RepID=UPI00397A49D6